MLLIGHRGCYYPGYNQNTIRAFKKVTSEGVPAIEFDVQLCSDGHLVVIHNLDLEEVSTGNGKVSTTDSRTLKTLYAGDPIRGKDHIPFLPEVLDFFASVSPEHRPAIHLELKGENTSSPTGKLLTKYIATGKLHLSDILVSSCNLQELKHFHSVCPTIRIALLEGSIHRKQLLKKIGVESECYLERVFSCGRENYMFPRFIALADNLTLLDQECPDPRVRSLLAEEMKMCLSGAPYTDKLLEAACNMDAVSINLWHRSVTPQFIDKAHDCGLKVLVFTVNSGNDLQACAKIGVDGIFTDYYLEAVRLLAD